MLTGGLSIEYTAESRGRARLLVYPFPSLFSAERRDVSEPDGQGLPALGAMSVAALRSKASLASPAADVMFEELVATVKAS